MVFSRLLAFFGFLFIVSVGAIASAQTVFMVQLGTFRSDSEANQQWQKLTESFPDLFMPLSYTPTEITLPPDDFVYHRNQAGPIATRGEAENLCNKLMEKNFECYVVETAMFATGGSASGSAKKEESSAAKEDAAPVPETLQSMPEEVAEQQDKGIYAYVNAKPAPTTPMEAAANAASAESLATPPEMSEIPAKPEAAKVENEPSDAEELPVALPDLKPEESAAAVPAPAAVVPVTPPAQPSVQEPVTAALPEQSAQPAVAMPQVGGQRPWMSSRASQPDIEAPAETVAVVPDMPPVVATGTQPITQPSLQSRQEVVVPMIPQAPAAEASVQVGEAIPVPLSEPSVAPMRTRAAAVAASRPSVFLGYPSQMTRSASIWAEITYFTSEQAALGYWSTLRGRDAMIPNGLRLRVTRPFFTRASSGTQKLSLRVGPFSDVNAVRRLCALTRPEALTCRAIKDLGASVNPAITSRESAAQSRYRMQQNRQYMKRPMMTFGGASVYWVQLGSFMSAQAAQDKWQEMSSSYPGVLSRATHQIYVPQRSSGAMLYRLRTGPYNGAADAVNACESIKSQGGICAVVRD